MMMSENRLANKLIILCVSLFCVLSMCTGLEKTVSAENDPIDYVDANGAPLSCDSYTLINAGLISWENEWFVADGEITIDDRITTSGDVNVILCDGAKLTLSKGITVLSGTSFTVWGQENQTGKLIARSSNGDAGIGGTFKKVAGNIIINGGDIEAYGSSHPGTDNADKGGSAGIGGGTSSGADNITINAGKIKARGSDIDGMNGGAGIGGGRGSLATITITGGKIDAESGGGGAGIGSGYISNGYGNITITGGDITARSKANVLGDGAGIGGGENTEGGIIRISGGHIKAYGSIKAASSGNYYYGIGGGGGNKTPENSRIILSYSSPYQDMSVFSTHFGHENKNTVILEKDFRDLDTYEMFTGSSEKMENSSILNGRTLVPSESVLLNIPITVEMGEKHEDLAANWADHLPESYAASAAGSTVSIHYPKKTGDSVTTVKMAQTALHEDLVHFLANYDPAYYDKEESYLRMAQQTIGNYTSENQIINEMNASTGALEKGQVFYALWEIPIREIDLDLKAPVCGKITLVDKTQDPLPVVTAENENVVIEKTWWAVKGTSWDQYSGPINAGEEYEARMTIGHAFGYTLGWAYLAERDVKVNGVKARIVAKNSDEWQIAGSVKAVHDWGKVTYTWADDDSSVTGSRTCRYDPEHKEKLTAPVVKEITKRPTFTEKGETTYTAEFHADGYETQTKTLKNIDALGHDWGDWIIVKEATETEDGLKRRVCKNDPEHKEEIVLPSARIWYYVDKGNGNQWTRGSGESSVFVFKRSEEDSLTYGYFEKLFVDGEELDASKYTKQSGSLVITLIPDYLKNLKTGKHEMTASFIDGSSGLQAVSAKEERKPDTYIIPVTGIE